MARTQNHQKKMTGRPNYEEWLAETPCTSVVGAGRSIEMALAGPEDLFECFAFLSDRQLAGNWVSMVIGALETLLPAGARGHLARCLNIVKMRLTPAGLRERLRLRAACETIQHAIERLRIVHARLAEEENPSSTLSRAHATACASASLPLEIQGIINQLIAASTPFVAATARGDEFAACASTSPDDEEKLFTDIEDAGAADRAAELAARLIESGKRKQAEHTESPHHDQTRAGPGDRRSPHQGSARTGPHGARSAVREIPARRRHAL